MDASGIEIRPIVEMTGAHSFNEVFLSDVRIPVANRVGEENRGWELAKVTLANERVSLSSGGVLWGNGPTAYELIEAAGDGGVEDPLTRQRLAILWTEARLLDLVRLRTLTARIKGQPPGPEASIRKLMADVHGQHAMRLALDLRGPGAMVAAGELAYGFLFAPALTIGGGTAEVQRNIIGERVLGLPRDQAGR
jgi:3-oxochol-4-en-24-oyl-CoA dehydrogenase